MPELNVPASFAGKIQHCNQAFVDVSGFSREELIGQPHNIVRHPDMPSEAYENMWSCLKAGPASFTNSL